MKIFGRGCLGVFVFATAVALSLSTSLVAKAASRQPSRKPTAESGAGSGAPAGVWAIVKIEGANVYTEPDFDAEVVGDLGYGQRVRVSRGVTNTPVKFRKIRVGGHLGYVSDIDVQIEGAPSGAGGDAGDAASKNKSKNKTKKDERGKKKNAKAKKSHEHFPIFFTRYFGVALGATFFHEDISGVNANETLFTYGLKATGPDLLLTGPVLDMNLVLHYGAPAYYGPLSKIPPSGFLLLTDVLLLFPLMHRDDSLVYAGVGPLLDFTSFKVFNNNQSMDLTALNLGASFSLGGAIRFDRTALRLEGKYMWEKQSQKLIQLSIQTEI